MNTATLETMQRILDQIRPPKPTWVWRGKNPKQATRGLTEEQARTYQLQFGGQAEKQA